MRPGKSGLDAVAHSLAVALILGGVLAFCFNVLLELLTLVNGFSAFFGALPESGRVCRLLGERLGSKFVCLFQCSQKKVEGTQDVNLIALQAL